MLYSLLRSLLWLLAGALALAQPKPAAAQAKTALSWVREQGAENCIGAPELGRRIEKLVGPVLAAAPEGEISIEGGIKKSGSGFEAAVAVSDASGKLLGRRTVHGDNPDCRTLDDQIAFVIAVAIDPNAALAELPGEFAQDTHPEAELLHDLEANPPRPAPLPPRARAPQAHARDAETDAEEPGNWHAGGSLGGAGALGIMPSVSAGLTAAFSLWTGTWSHHARATYWFPQRETLNPGNDVALGLSELELATCPELWSGAGFHLAPCAGIAIARLSVEPHGFVGRSQARWLAGPLLSIRLARTITGPLSLVVSAAAEGLWPRHRIEYELAGAAQLIWAMPAVAGRADLSLELRF